MLHSNAFCVHQGHSPQKFTENIRDNLAVGEPLIWRFCRGRAIFLFPEKLPLGTMWEDYNRRQKSSARDVTPGGMLGGR